MAKKMNRRKTNRPKASPTRLRLNAELYELKGNLRQQRKIRRLTGELQRAIVAADDGLRMIGRIAIERDLPHSAVAGDRDDDRDLGLIVGVLDARD